MENITIKPKSNAQTLTPKKWNWWWIAGVVSILIAIGVYIYVRSLVKPFHPCITTNLTGVYSIQDKNKNLLYIQGENSYMTPLADIPNRDIALYKFDYENGLLQITASSVGTGFVSITETGNLTLVTDSTKASFVCPISQNNGGYVLTDVNNNHLQSVEKDGVNHAIFIGSNYTNPIQNGDVNPLELTFVSSNSLCDFYNCGIGKCGYKQDAGNNYVPVCYCPEKPNWYPVDQVGKECSVGCYYYDGKTKPAPFELSGVNCEKQCTRRGTLLAYREQNADDGTPHGQQIPNTVISTLANDAFGNYAIPPCCNGYKNHPSIPVVNRVYNNDTGITRYHLYCGADYATEGNCTENVNKNTCCDCSSTDSDGNCVFNCYPYNK